MDISEMELRTRLPLAFQVLHTYTAIGTYPSGSLPLIPPPAILADTAYLKIRVRTDRAIMDFDITKLPPCQSLNYHVYQYIHPSGGKTIPARIIYLGFRGWYARARHQSHHTFLCRFRNLPGATDFARYKLLQLPGQHYKDFTCITCGKSAI